MTTTLVRLPVDHLLSMARQSGVRVWVADSKVRYAPKDIPVGLLELLREHKEPLVGHLTPPAYVVDRLVRWQAWLTEAHAGLSSLPEFGVGSELERRFTQNLDAWSSLEAVYRPGWWDCVHGPVASCPDGSPVLCQVCAP